MTDPRVEPAAIALYVAVQPNHRTPEGWNAVKPIWRKHYESSAVAVFAALDKAATITTEAELDALPAGTLIMCANANPTWPEVFLHTGARDPWLMLDPSDRDDGESTLHSGNVLNWHGKGQVRVIHYGTE